MRRSAVVVGGEVKPVALDVCLMCVRLQRASGGVNACPPSVRLYCSVQAQLGGARQWLRVQGSGMTAIMLRLRDTWSQVACRWNAASRRTHRPSRCMLDVTAHAVCLHGMWRCGDTLCAHGLMITGVTHRPQPHAFHLHVGSVATSVSKQHGSASQQWRTTHRMQH